MKMRNWLAVISLLLSGVPSLAATYSYAAPVYTILSPSTSAFQPGMFAQGSFSTAVPLPANQPLTEITPLITGFSFSDGVTTFGHADPLVRVYEIHAATDASGAVTTFSLTLDRWQADSPHAFGSRFDSLSVYALGSAAARNALCIAVGASPVNGTPDVCTGRSPDENTSSAAQGGVALPVVAPPPSFRAYLAPNGLDTNACTLAAPCRLLPAALAAVFDGGEVWILKSGNYNSGMVDISKSVTILAVPGALGSVAAKGGSAINIATAGVKVVLRNLVIVPVPGSSGRGITMTAGAGLTVENCVLADLNGVGINVATAATVLVIDTTIRRSGGGLQIQNGARVTVTRSTFSENFASAIQVQGWFGGTASTTTADISESIFNANMMGLTVITPEAAVLQVTLSDSQVVGSNMHGASVSSTSAAATLSVSNSVFSNNGAGITASGAGARAWASGNTVSNNFNGIVNSSGAVFESAGDNVVRNNTSQQSSGTITVAPKI